MMLQTGNPDVRFKPRLVEGLTLASSQSPNDSSWTDSSDLPPCSWHCCPITRSPHVIEETIQSSGGTTLTSRRRLSPNGDREEAIVGIPEDRQIRNFRNEVIADYSTTEKECAVELFPLHLVYDTPGLMAWQRTYVKVAPGHMEERLRPLQPVARVRDPAVPAISNPPHPHAKVDTQGGCLPGLREGQYRRSVPDRVRVAHGDLRRGRVQPARGLGRAVSASRNTRSWRESRAPTSSRE